MNRSKNLVWLTILALLATGCGGQRALTVADVIQNAARLNGKIIRVRGIAYLWIDPSQAEMWMTGGCIPKTDPSYRQGVVVGWLTLYDSEFSDTWGGDNTPRDEAGISISESVFHCNGDYCQITCSPFEVVSGQTYEFVGTLRLHEDSDFILEKIDLGESRQLVAGEWMSIHSGDFHMIFP